ncbi:MAG TPA: alkaline phosphatase D family protein, partial [Bryobacteraceae bacterium]
QAANQAWAEYGLADVPFNPSADWEHSLQVYRKFSFGTLADLVVTDERLYRDGPPCGNNELFGRSFSVGCPGLYDSNRTMLGAVQRQWFLSQISGSKALWKLWANEVMLMQLKLAGAVFVNLDQWDGYPKERSAILGAIKKAGVQNVIALTGDLHTFLAGYLKTDFNNPFESPMGIELIVGSVTSANLAEGIVSAVPLPSCPIPAKQFGVPPNLLEPQIRDNNPHIHYWDSSTHGYGILDITPARLVCTFKAVTSIRSPSADLVTLKTFTIPAGQIALR